MKSGAVGAVSLGLSGGVLNTLSEMSTREGGIESYVGEDTVVQSVCAPNCRGKCPLDVYVRDNRIKKIQPHVPEDERYERGCVLGLSHTQRVYDPTRLKYPMRRTDWSPDDPNPEGRGEDAEFEVISWNEALDIVAEKMNETKEQSGAESILWHAGSGNDGFGAAYKSRFASLFGGTTDGFFYGIDTNVGQGFRRVAENKWGAFLPTTNAPTNWDKNRTLIFWGSDVFRSQHQMDTDWVLSTKESGSKWVAIDPVYTTTAAKADLWLPIKPGKDTHVALAMMHSIFQEETYDEEFLRKRSVAPALVRQDTGALLRAAEVFEDGDEETFVAMDAEANELVGLEPETTGQYALFGEFTVNGIEVRTALTELRDHVSQYPPDTVGDIAGVDPDDIRTVARWLATRGAGGIMPSYGVGRYLYGHVFGQAYAILMALTGDYGNPGNIHNHHINLWGANQGVSIGNYTAPTGGGGEGVSSSPTTGIGYKDVLGQMEDDEFDVIYAMESNMIANNFPDRQRWLDAMNNVDMVVWADMQHTTSVQHSDIVFPVCHWFEKEDVVAAYPHPHIMYRHKVQEPLWESKSDYWIFNELANRLGHEDAFIGDKREELRKLVGRDDNLDFEELREQGTVEMDYSKIEFQGEFNNSGGRLNLYDEDAPTEKGPGLPEDGVSLELPEPLEARTADDYDKQDEYPLLFMQKHGVYDIHSQYEMNNWVREIKNEPTLDIHPKTAKERNIDDGEYVRAYNENGEMVVKARYNEGMQPGLTNTDHGWWPRDYVEGHHNDLTDSETAEVGRTFAFYDTRIEVEPEPSVDSNTIEEPQSARLGSQEIEGDADD
jgi:anaerobic dimethyl sulfoxide reductase subunit A